MSKNTGNKSLKLPPALAVGSFRSTHFMMHPGMDGKHNYAVHLVTNDPAHPDMVGNVLSNWSQ